MNEERVYNFIIDKDSEGQRIDSVLSCLIEDASRSYIARLIEDGAVSVNGIPAKSKSLKLKPGASVSVEFPNAKPIEALPEDIPLDIVYEDEDLIVINKPRGMVVHPAPGNESGTLVNALLHHCGHMSSINGNERPGIVHRIDKDTSGLLVCAKSDKAHQGLSEQLSVHSMTRRYIGICHFELKNKQGTIDAPLGRDPKNRLKMAVVENGKRAVTHYRELSSVSGFSCFEARLETGRTHQIRVHMAYKNHPLLGDPVYGPAKCPVKLNGESLRGQMLHAKVLGFVHPVTGEYMEFSAELPSDFIQCLSKLGLKSESE